MALNTGCKFTRRAGDDLEHFRRRGLLLQRLTEIVGALLHLVEQPHVLDRDHCLVGESFDQRDLLVGERFDLELVDLDGAHQLIVLEHRHRHTRADRVHIAGYVTVFGVSLNIGDLDRPALKRGAARDAMPAEGNRVS